MFLLIHILLVLVQSWEVLFLDDDLELPAPHPPPQDGRESVEKDCTGLIIPS
jgi:hypothetical protein